MSDAKHGETRMQAQARLLPVPTNTPGAVANITRRAALLGLSVPVVMAATATAAGLPDADGELLALCREFHKLSADIERLDVPGRSEETPEQVAAWEAQNAVAEQVAGMVPTTFPGFLAKLAVVFEDHADSGDIRASLMLALLAEGHALAGLPLPPMIWLRQEVAGEWRRAAGGVQ